MNCIKIRDLNLAHPLEVGRPVFISAASGLIRVGDLFYTIADDELSLCAFEPNAHIPGSAFPIFPGALPVEAKERKKQKPDLEALIHFQAGNFSNRDTLLAIPSGSTKNRMTGVLVELTPKGERPNSFQHIDFSGLYSRLSDDLPELNIEGAVICGPDLKLFQRGNGACGINAVIRLDWVTVKSELIKGALSAASVKGIYPVDLGMLEGIPLSFTDAAFVDENRILFSAVAEDSKDTYQDGQCLGSVVGLLSEDKIILMERINPLLKIEGVSVQLISTDAVELFLVTDQDDPHHPAGLYSAVLSLSAGA